MLAVEATKRLVRRMDNLKGRLRWRAHACETAEVAAGDYFTGVAEKEHPGELQLRSRRALWEQWVCRQAVLFLDELDRDPSKLDEIAAVWTVYETCAENVVHYGIVPEFEEWLREVLPRPN
jgi:hypothetical protein